MVLLRLLSDVEVFYCFACLWSCLVVVIAGGGRCLGIFFLSSYIGLTEVLNLTRETESVSK